MYINTYLPRAFALLIAAATTASSTGALLITGVVDGGEAGGNPKALELYATTPIPDLSVFSIGRYTNGGDTLSSETELPAVALGLGEFFYITGNADSDTILNTAGFTVGASSQSVLNVNGDDILVITDGAGITLDSFGSAGQGDTDFYEDSVALRNHTSSTPDSDGSADAADNFTITAWTSTTDFASQFGTFEPVPEPSIAVLGGLGVLGLLRRRR